MGPASMTSIHLLRIVLRDTKPPIWRRMAVPSTIRLGQLHDVIQIVMGWTDSHLHRLVLRDKSLKPSRGEIRRMTQFDEVFINRMHGERVFVPYTTPFGDDTELEGEDEDAVKLAEVCPRPKSKLIYEYDFGDGWQHTITVQKITEPEAGIKYPICLAGKGACPPEDCGGVWGYYEMLGVVKDPKHQMHKQYSEWLGEGYDPEAFDIDEVNAALAEWRKGKA